jgi:hypothetical protein
MLVGALLKTGFQLGIGALLGGGLVFAADNPLKFQLVGQTRQLLGGQICHGVSHSFDLKYAASLPNPARAMHPAPPEELPAKILLYEGRADMV